MKKKVLAAFLTGCMAVGMLAGCGSGDSGSSSSGGSSGGSDTAEEGGSGEVETVVMAYMNWAGMPTGASRVAELISDYMEEKIGVRLELEIMDSATYRQDMTLMLSSGEQVDLFNAISIGYTACINNDYVLDLEENDLIQTYGQDILSTLDEDFVNACRVNGTLYGLPQQRDMAAGLWGFAIGAEYLDAIGYDYASMYKEGEEVIYGVTLDDISDIFAQLHEQFPDLYVHAPQEATITGQGPNCDAVGGDTFGVLQNPTESLTVVNYYETEEFREMADYYYAWNQAGYISKDALTDDTAATAQVKAGTCMSYATATKPGIKQQESNLCGRDMIIFQCGETVMKSSAVASMPWCINSGTEVPEAAMKALNMMYSDPYVSNLLCWGEEGKEWQYAEDGEHITFADGVDAEKSEYYNNVNWELPNQFIANIWEGDSLDIWDKMATFNSDSEKSKALGFTFDNSEVAAEYTALTNVYNEYVKSIAWGFTEPESGIAELTEKLEAAGLSTYMEAKQAALDEWAEANGVS